MEDKWKLGDDLLASDNLLDSISFEDIILMVHHNSKQITAREVVKQFEMLLEIRMQDAKFLLKNNLNEIMDAARKGRA